MPRDHDNRSNPPTPPRYRKRVLAVQAMAGETAWLDGHLRWRDGRVVWETAQGTRAPAPADLALAARRLNQIARYRIAAGHALGNPAAWLARRRARLALAKALHALRAPDLPALCDRARSAGDGTAIHRLVPLLAPEVLCLDGLPAAPSAALLAAGAAASGPLLAGVEDETAPPAGRALAALILGALRHRQAAAGDPGQPPAAVRAVEWLQRAYAWGRRAGLPSDPALVVTLLALPDGPALAARYEAVARDPGPFALPVPTLRELLATGAPAGRVVPLVEALATARSLAARILQYRDELPDRPLERRRAAAYVLQQERQQIVAALTEIVQAYALATVDPDVIEALVNVTQDILSRGALTGRLSEALLAELRAGLNLAPPLQSAYLRLLIEPIAQAQSLDAWINTRSSARDSFLVALLRETEDYETVREAFRLEISDVLARFHWPERRRYQWVLAAVRPFKRDEYKYWIWSLCRVLDKLPDAATAQVLLEPLLQAMQDAPWAMRRGFLEGVLGESTWVSQEVRAGLPRLTRYLPLLLPLVSTLKLEDWQIEPIVVGIVAIDRAVADQPEPWVACLLAALAARTATRSPDVEDGPERGLPLRLAVPLALTLAGNDRARFQTLIHTALQQRFNAEWPATEGGVEALPRWPTLRAVLARSFPHQPQRCIDLLERITLALRFGRENLAPLAALDPSSIAEPAPYPPDWQPLLDLAPDLAPLVAAYCHARRLIGAATEMPAGVRRALEQPIKWTSELAFLDRRVAQEPGRADLATRATNLRARLADPATRAVIAQEAGERLEQIAAEAGLAAAEHQIRACYRARLAELVTPLPTDLVMDDDWLNATLLLGAIQQNRRLLLRLVRSYLSGNRAWPEQHPTNQAFLQDLAQYGVDTAAWLATMPRHYRCPGVPGGRVRLHLERDPLHILQMGNYFDTCLSFGGGNAFSTVANACELNKRVIYAVDGAGRVVGRKLIGLDADARLIGFRTYTALRDRAGNAALRSIFRRYCAAFAARCGLALTDDGTVPRLFAEAWYDDGSVPWTEDEPPPRPSSAPSRPAASEHA